MSAPPDQLLYVGKPRLAEAALAQQPPAPALGDETSAKVEHWPVLGG